MSYVNKAGQTVKEGVRIAYAGYMGYLYLGKVVGFTDKGSPRVELEGRTQPMVRSRYYSNKVHPKVASANIWDRRPYTHYRHTTTGALITSDAFAALPRDTWNSTEPSPRDDYERDQGQLSYEWIEFEAPETVAIVKRDYVMVIEEAQQ